MKKTTLALIIKNNQILLAMKKRGFGVGKWNGYGGKIMDDETPKQAAVRETEEEIVVKAEEVDLEKHGDFTFYFENNPDFDTHTELFIIKKWQGEPIETEEMLPQWFDFNNIPFDKMWIDDKHWLPQVLAGKKLDGKFWFNSDGSVLIKYQLNNL